MAEFRERDRVRVTATGAEGTVESPDYVHGGVLVMPDEPERPWAPLTPYLPFELEPIPVAPVDPVDGEGSDLD